MTDETVEILLEVGSTRFDPLDERWQRRIDELVIELWDQVRSVRRALKPLPGSKGGLETIVVSLGSAGVVTGVFELVKSWIARDRSRSVKFSWYEDGTLQHVEISGSRLNDEAMDRALQTLTKRLETTA